MKKKYLFLLILFLIPFTCVNAIDKQTPVTLNVCSGNHSANANKDNILTTFSAYDNQNKLNGSMPNNGTISKLLNLGETYNIPLGYTKGGNITTQTLASQTSATSKANQILKDKTGWVNGEKVTGTIPTKGATTYYPSSSDQTIAAGQYLGGKQTIKAIKTTNLTADNIVKGVTVEIGDSSDSDSITSISGNYQTYESIFLNTTLVKSYTEGEWLCSRNRRVSTATLNVNYTGQYVIFMSYGVRYSGQAQAYAYPCTITSISPDASYTQIAPGAYLVELNGQHTININTGVSDGSCTNTGGYYAIYKVNN